VKIKKSELKKLIKEEIEAVLREAPEDFSSRVAGQKQKDDIGRRNRPDLYKTADTGNKVAKKSAALHDTTAQAVDRSKAREASNFRREAQQKMQNGLRMLAAMGVSENTRAKLAELYMSIGKAAALGTPMGSDSIIQSGNTDPAKFVKMNPEIGTLMKQVKGVLKQAISEAIQNHPEAIDCTRDPRLEDMEGKKCLPDYQWKKDSGGYNSFGQYIVGHEYGGKLIPLTAESVSERLNLARGELQTNGMYSAAWDARYRHHSGELGDTVDPEDLGVR